MPKPTLYPLTFEPVLKDYIWGGRNLETLFGRALPPGVDIAESWEISAHPHGDVTVANGPLRGRSLAWLTAEYGAALVGSYARPVPSRCWSSCSTPTASSPCRSTPTTPTRVHENGELGKSERWVVLHAEPEAAVILGLQPGATRERFREALETGNLEPWMHVLPVRAGDAICVPAGTLHAILGGSVLAEIQQNSDATYRVYDWNRTGPDGRPRPLHVEKALDVINFGQVQPGLAEPRLLDERAGIRRWQLCCGPTFVVERLEVAAGAVWQERLHGRSMEIWGSTRGHSDGGSGGRVAGAAGRALQPAPGGRDRSALRQRSRRCCGRRCGRGNGAGGLRPASLSRKLEKSRYEPRRSVFNSTEG